MPGNKELGAKIKQARAERGWKQKHLAAEVSVEPITVSRWERGATTPDLDVLGLVADATGKPLSFFVDHEPPPEAAPQVADAVTRLEEAADRMADASDRIAAAAADLVAELRATRGGS